ncbi:MAG: energy-coupling factor ABC transporter permease [Gammaproteobacteria bacterium]
MALTAPLLRHLGMGVAMLAVALALWRAPWWWLRQPGSVHVLGGATVILLVLWQLRAGIGEGPWLHLLGATVLTLMFSWQFALLAITSLLAASLLRGHGDLASWGLNLCVMGVLPVALSYRLARLVERGLAPNFFIYVFVSAFLGAAVVVACVAGAGALVAIASGVAREHVLGNYLPSSVLIVFPEAFATGGCMTLAVVYRPQWVVSFDDRRYLDGR